MDYTPDEELVETLKNIDMTSYRNRAEIEKLLHDPLGLRSALPIKGNKFSLPDWKEVKINRPGGFSQPLEDTEDVR